MLPVRTIAGLVATAAVVAAVSSRGAYPQGRANVAIRATLDAYRLPLVHARLGNGLHVVVSEDHVAPVVVVNVMYRAGVRVESPGRSGLAHFFEHLMFQGTRAMDKNDYARTITSLGGRYNGATRVDYANYYTVAPASALDLLLWIEADRMRGLHLTVQSVENQRAVVLEEIRQSQEQSRQARPAGEVLQALAFREWRNAHSAYGEPADIGGATIEDMRAFYDRFYGPSNAVVVVAGDCDPRRVIARAREYFGPLAGAAVAPAAVPEPRPPDGERVATESVDGARHVSLTIGYRLPARTDPAFLALALLDTLLARDGTGLLRRHIVDETRVAASVASWFHDLGNDFDFDGPMLYTLQVEGAPGRSAPEILAAVDDAVSSVATGLTDEQLADARRRYALWFLDQLAGPGNPYATRAKTIAAFTLFEGSPEGINRVLPAIGSTSVAAVRAAARTYLTARNRVLLVRQPK